MARVSVKFVRRLIHNFCRFVLNMAFYFIWFPYQWSISLFPSHTTDNIGADSYSTTESSWVIPKIYGVRFICLEKDTYARFSNFGTRDCSSYQSNELRDNHSTHIQIRSHTKQSGVYHRVSIANDTLHFLFHDFKSCKPYYCEQFNKHHKDNGSPSVFVYVVEEGSEESIDFCINEYNKLGIWESTRFAILITVRNTNQAIASNDFQQRSGELIGGYLSKYIDHHIILDKNHQPHIQQNALKVICQIAELVHANKHNIYL
eukprot:255773_1